MKCKNKKEILLDLKKKMHYWKP